MDNPKVELRIDDARHFLLTTSETFDAITSDLVDPWVKGVATLFTREFFELVKRHLNPAASSRSSCSSTRATPKPSRARSPRSSRCFPTRSSGAIPNDGQGYDLVLTGQVEPFRIDVDQWQARLDSPPYAEVARSLREIGIGSAVELLSNYAGSAADLAPWLADATINRDRNLRLQYLAGMGMNQYRSGSIYAEMLRHAKFPEDLFTGSPASVQALKNAVRARGEQVVLAFRPASGRPARRPDHRSDTGRPAALVALGLCLTVAACSREGGIAKTSAQAAGHAGRARSRRRSTASRSSTAIAGSKGTTAIRTTRAG